MSKGLFITATGTDIGKTYVTALLVKTLRSSGINCGYYKAAISGAPSIQESDAGYVNRIANIEQAENTLVSYLYNAPVSPHLASKLEGNPVNLNQVKTDYELVCKAYDYVITEGSGGIVCPIRWDDSDHILLEDIIKSLSIPTLVIADAGLGTINATALTVAYLKQKQIPVSGIILNRFNGSHMHHDNIKMIEAITGISIIATIEEGALSLSIPTEKIIQLFEKE